MANDFVTANIDFTAKNQSSGGTFTGGQLTSGLTFTPDNTLDIGADGATRPRTVYAGTRFLSGDGSAPAPSYSFDSSETDGLYLSGVNSLGIATAGVGRFQFNASGHMLAITDNSFDIGSNNATRPRSGYFGTDVSTPILRINSGANSGGVINLSSNKVQFTAGGAAAIYGFNFLNTAVASSGAQTFFTMTPASNTAQTAGTEISGYQWNTFTRQWASNTAITTQREVVVNAPTYAFASATGTITTAATFYVSGAPIVGTNAAITTSIAAWIAGRTRIDGLLDLSNIAAGTSNISITKTSDTPTTTFSAANATNAAPSGFIEITEGGTSKYIPFYT